MRDRGAFGRGIISADRARVRAGESILAEVGKLPGVGAGVGAVQVFGGGTMMAVGDREVKDLTKRGKCEKMIADGRWISCPACGNGRLLRVPMDARAYHMPVFCMRCRGYVEIDID